MTMRQYFLKGDDGRTYQVRASSISRANEKLEKVGLRNNNAGTNRQEVQR
jgi:hypothetical protein